MAPTLGSLLHRRGDSSNNYTLLVPLLTSIFGVIVIVCLVGFVWCFVRRRKHRAPVIPYHLHTIAPPKDPNNPQADGGTDAATADTNQGEAEQGKKKKTKRPPAFGQEGRGVGFGFNPVFNEAYGGGGRIGAGLEGVTAQRIEPRWA